MHDTTAVLADVEASVQRFLAATAVANESLDQLAAQHQASLEDLVKSSDEFTATTLAEIERLSRALQEMVGKREAVSNTAT